MSDGFLEGAGASSVGVGPEEGQIASFPSVTWLMDTHCDAASVAPPCAHFEC